MISFRHHVVSLLAVLLALAAGVALGGGPLSDIGRTAGPELRSENNALRADLAAVRSEAGFADTLNDEYAATVAAGKLAGQRVALVTLPGSDDEVVSALRDLVATAGGSVVGNYAVAPSAFGASGKSLVDTLGAQLAESVKEIPDTATTYVRLGQLFGRTLTGTGKADATQTSLSSSLVAAKLITPAPESQPGATLVLVVLGDTGGGDTSAALADLLTGLDAEATGSVTVASSASAEDGPLARLRAEQRFADALSSVDSVQSGAGRLVAVLALAAEAAGKRGHYGAHGADGATPGT